MVELGALSRVVVAGTALAVSGCTSQGFVGWNSAHNTSGGGGTTGSVSDESSGGAQTTASEEDDEGSTHAITSAEEEGGSTTEEVRFDVGFLDVPAACEAPVVPPCDERDSDPWHALGLDCPGSVIQGSFSGAPEQLFVLDGQLGTSGAFAPREGQRMVILSTGDASHIPETQATLAVPPINCNQPLACPSTYFFGPSMAALPDPISMRRVSDKGATCADDPQLIGEGDCSNTLWDEWVQAEFTAYDYAELRMNTVVPPGASGLAYSFAFFSAEYPSFENHGTGYNDMYIAWLDSELWTGNISFDEMGNPVTAKSVFLDYKDAPSGACQGTCDAPELANFAMEGHAGTKWLVTNAPAKEGEHITLVFAILDAMDGSYDSAVILDNFEWTCSGEPPFTAPG
ncbi:MAG TPA: choice-of-anchor L domain-containing protein [Nannocystaceae bacterium]|nr:choice-of-anchor L domain-containing protein [Nannocystaceae bacterium]